MELARLGMGVARQLHDVALQTTDAEALVALATAYHHVSRGVRQSLALKARFAAGTVAPGPRAEATGSAVQPSGDESSDDEPVERDDAYERPDWHTRLPADERLEALHPDDDVCRARIARDLTIVSRTPALAKIPTLQAPAAQLAGRAALLARTSLKLVNTS